MTQKLKLTLIIGLAVGLVALFVLDQPAVRDGLENIIDRSSQKPVLVEPTGRIDDLVKDVVLEAETEESIVAQDDEDYLLLDDDREEIEQIGESYEESDF